MKNTGVILGLALLIAGVVAMQWYRTGSAANSDPLEKAAARLNATFPKPYVDGLVMEHAHADGKRLVIDIRFPDVHLAQLSQKKIPSIREQEAGDLVEATCMAADFRELLHDGYSVARRFLDKDHMQIFEVAVSERDCTPEVVE